MKYINLKQVFLVLATLCICLSSCNKYLDTTPDNRTEIDSVEKVSQLLASAYPKASYAAMVESRCDYIDDKGKGTENNNNTDGFYWRDVADVSQDTPSWFWQKCYFSIAEVNHAFEAIEKLTDAEKKQVTPYIGEAHMIRAFSHFLVASLYSNYFTDTPETAVGVPYVDEPETVVIKQYDRSTVAKINEKIEEDMAKGFELLGSDAVYKVPRYHFTAKAAHAFATRYYLYNKKWEKVIEHASKVIPVPTEFIDNGNVSAGDPAYVYIDNNFQPWTGQYQTVPSSDDIKSYFTNGSNPSNLLLTEMSSRLARYANTWRYGVNGTTIKQIYSSTPAGTTLAYKTYSSSSTHYYVPKFREHFVRTSLNASTGYIYTIHPYFRNEEVLLNRAEAYAMLGQYENALHDINMFYRKRIKSYKETTHYVSIDKVLDFYEDACEYGENHLNKYNPYGAADWDVEKKALILCILDLRNMEFKWEGLRYWDLMRYKIPVTHTNLAGETNTLYPGDDRWILQIPEEATLSGLELNPRTNLLSKEW